MKQHKLSKHPIYGSWSGMKQRCLDLKHPAYKNYGGRGIKICDRWLKFENFRDDMLSSWKKGTQLDRINNDGKYEPSNCRWATALEHGKNRQKPAKKQSKYPGVCAHINKWRVCSPRPVFNTEEKAYQAYLKIAEFIKTLAT